MKIKHFLFGGILTLAMSLGICTTVFSYNSTQAKVEETKEVGAATYWSSSNTVYLRIFKAWIDTDSQVVYLRYYSSDGWKNYSPTPIGILGGDGTYYYYSHTFTNAPTTDIYVKRYGFVPDDGSDAANNTCTLSRDHGSSNLISIQYNDNWNYGYYCGTNICNYHFKSPSNGSVTVSVKDSGGTSKGNATLANADNYIYSDWKVTLTATANSGYGFSHWTEATSKTATHTAWQGSDLRTNPKANMTNMFGNVYHGAVFKQYKTIYYISGENYNTTNRIYAWTTYSTASGSTNVEEFGSYAECWAITNEGVGGTEVLGGVVHFNGSQNKIYRISLFSDNFLLRNSDGTVQTGDYSVTNGCGYYWNESGDTGGKSTDAGTAVALIIDAEAARNAVTASGNIKYYSICGIPQFTIDSLVSRYNGLSSAARTLVDASTTYTYKGDGTSAQADISFADIFGQLSTMTSGAKSQNIGLFMIGGGKGSSMTVIIIVSTLVAVSAVGGFFLLRKRKEQ